MEEDIIHETLLSIANIQDDNNNFLKKTMNSTYDVVEEDFVHETPLSTSNIQLVGPSTVHRLSPSEH